VPTDTLTKNERVSPERVARVVGPERTDSLRELALERIYRLRRFHMHLVVFAVGLPILGLVWMLTEYYEEHTWPSRFASNPDVAGTWDPWFFWVAGIWFIILAVHALRTYFGPPVGPVQRYIRRAPTEAEVVREVDQLQSHRWIVTGPHIFGH
jgi:2TM domain-containing protein